ncbi:hypothetical protein O6H91_Y496500 [Diphasiastrum complanatum]|nr:hypothetical protein O6H91_Y496500 [Diphasiastrum complanatum]
MMTFLVWKILWRKRIAEKQSSDYMSGILRKFSYKELQTATSNFKEELGAGGFGSVYIRLPSRSNHGCSEEAP